MNALSNNNCLSAVTVSSNNICLSGASVSSNKTNPNSNTASFKLCNSTPANLNLYSESSQDGQPCHHFHRNKYYTIILLKIII